MNSEDNGGRRIFDCFSQSGLRHPLFISRSCSPLSGTANAIHSLVSIPILTLLLVLHSSSIDVTSHSSPPVHWPHSSYIRSSSSSQTDSRHDDSDSLYILSSLLDDRRCSFYWCEKDEGNV